MDIATNQVNQVSFIPDMGEINRLRAEIESLKRERGELIQIITTPSWRPAERILYATVRLQAQMREGGQRVAPITTIARIAKIAGLSDRTVSDKLEQFKCKGLLEYSVTRWAEDAEGKAIHRRIVDKTRGDRYMCEARVSVPNDLPRPLPELIEGRNNQRSKEAASVHRREFARLKIELQAMLEHAECPHCHETGKIELDITGVCSGCGTLFDEKQIEYLARKPEFPEDAKFTVYGDPPKTAEIPLTANFAVYGNASETAETGEGDGKVCSYVLLPKLQTFPTAQEETLSEERVTPVVTPQSDQPEILTGADSVQWLGRRGARFSLAYPRSKAGVGVDFLDNPMDPSSAAAHLATGGNIGMLAEHSINSLIGGLVLIDADTYAQEFCASDLRLNVAARIIRDNAPDRAKVLVRVTDKPDGIEYLKTCRCKSKMACACTHKLEVFGNGHHAIVAGVHETGVQIKLVIGNIPMVTHAELIGIVTSWVPDMKAEPVPESSLSVSKLNPVSGEDLVSASIHWWNEQSENVAEVERLLSGRKHAGKFLAIRDERTPSAKATKRGDALVDYGADDEITDRYELYCRLTNTDKRTHKWTVAHAYLIAHGRIEAAGRLAVKVGL